MEKLIKELNAWIIFYKNGSINAPDEKHREYNKGVTDGIKLIKDLARRHNKLFSKEELDSIN